MTLYVIAALYALIAAVWGAYADYANEGKRTPASVLIGLLWPVTVPLASFMAWRIGREIKDMEHKLQEAQREREERLRGLGSDDMIKALWSEEIVKGANQAHGSKRLGWYETTEDEDWDDFWTP